MHHPVRFRVRPYPNGVSGGLRVCAHTEQFHSRGQPARAGGLASTIAVVVSGQIVVHCGVVEGHDHDLAAELGAENTGPPELVAQG